MRWERVALQGGERGGMCGEFGPGKRWGHTCNAIKGGRLLYVFGGYGRDYCQTNQVHVFDTVTQTWSEPVLQGTLPVARDSHSCTTVGDNLFVFGGTDGLRYLDDLHILDTSSHTWICPSVRGDGPDAREGHGAALVGKRLFIFGGCGHSIHDSTEVYYNDLYVLNTETLVWKCAATSGTPPSPRDTHSCSSWKNKIIVIGGEDAHDYYMSDVHILDTETLVWKELNTSGQILPPRAGHSTVSFGKTLFVFGGFTDAQNLYDDLYMLDVETGIWTKVIAIGDGPSARFAAAGDNLVPSMGGVLVFVGGCSRQLEALDDMYYLYTELINETGHNGESTERLSLRKQLKLKCQSQHLSATLHDKSLTTLGTTPNLCQPALVPIYDQPSTRDTILHESQLALGKRSFNAKVTQSFPHGYSIETIIDGKPLRGILFSNKQSSSHAPNSSRKRSAAEVVGVELCSDHNGKLRTENHLQQETNGHEQNHVVEKSTLLVTTENLMNETESAAASASMKSTPSDVSQPEKETSDNPEPSAPTVNSNDDSSIDRSSFDAPISSEDAPEENASSVVKDRDALPLDEHTVSLNDDWTNDVPFSSTEHLEENSSAAVENHAMFHLDLQAAEGPSPALPSDDKMVLDEEQNHLIKSI